MHRRGAKRWQNGYGFWCLADHSADHPLPDCSAVPCANCRAATRGAVSRPPVPLAHHADIGVRRCNDCRALWRGARYGCRAGRSDPVYVSDRYCAG